MTRDSAVRSCVDIAGIEIDSLDMPATLARLEEFIHSKQPHLIVTADASGIVAAQTDPDLKKIYHEAALVTPDSSGILWAAKKLGQPLKERVSGVDLVEQLCKLSSQKGYRIYFLGAAPEIAQLAAERLCEKFPGCQIVGVRDGFFSADQESAIVAEIAATQPDILFVAMGIPRQEKFIQRTMTIIGAPVAMGVGGSFDVFSGKTKRAPKLFQRLRLEWLWRLLLNPSKIGKVMSLPKFVMLVRRLEKQKTAPPA